MTELRFIEEIFKQNDNASRIESLDVYINSIENGMKKWLEKFEWDKETLISKHRKTDELSLNCPYNTGHTRIEKANYQYHIEKCRLKSLNYSKKDIKDYFNQAEIKSAGQIQLNEADPNDLIRINYDTHFELKKPSDLSTLTNDHYFIDLNTRERCGLYEYATTKFKNTSSLLVNNQKELQDLDKTETSTNLENVFSVDLRDRKRRPKSYKTNKSSSYTEQIKELIDYQMDLMKKVHEENMKNSDKLKVSHSKRRHSREEKDSQERYNEDDERKDKKKHKSHKNKKKSSSSKNRERSRSRDY